MRREAAVGLLVGAAVVAGLWSAPPGTAPATVTIDLRRLPVGKAAEARWTGSGAFAGVTAHGELGRRVDLGRTPPLSVSPDGTYAVTRYDERIMLVFRTDTGYPLFDLDVVAGRNRRVAWEPDGDLLLDIWHGGRVVAVRCRMTAECERAGGGAVRDSPRRSMLAAESLEVSYEQHRPRRPAKPATPVVAQREPTKPARRVPARQAPDRIEPAERHQWRATAWLSREDADRLERLAAAYRQTDHWRRADREPTDNRDAWRRFAPDRGDREAADNRRHLYQRRYTPDRGDHARNWTRWRSSDFPSAGRRGRR